jgi:hypothetical protein
MYEDLVRTAQYTHPVSVIKTSQLMLYREIIAVCSEIHTKHINTLCGQNVEFPTQCGLALPLSVYSIVPFLKIIQ